MKYEHFEFLEGDEPICRLFNRIMARMQPVRLFCAPRRLVKRKEDEMRDRQFADFCRYEMWMHAVVEQLRLWVDTIDEYMGEFDGSWKYYALSRMKEYMAEFGEDDLTDDDCLQFSVVSDLSEDEWNGMATETHYTTVSGFCGDIIGLSNVDIFASLRKEFGASFRAYKEDEDGEMHEVTPEEHDLDMALGKVHAEDDVKRVMAIAGGIYAIVGIIRDCPHDDDNTERLQAVSDASRAILSLDFDRLGTVVKEYREKLEVG